MVDIRFVSRLNEGGPTQFETGRRLCNKMYDSIAEYRETQMLRDEDAITALASVYLQIVEDAGYDAIGVTECLMAAKRLADQQRR